ncbi:FHA domain-containing protein [Mycobacterium sp. NPDC051198]
MRLCRAHGPFEGSDCPTEGCTEDWQPYVPPAPEPPDLCEVPGCEMPRPCPLHPQAGRHPQLQARRAEREAPAAQPAAGIVARLRFPWGAVAVPLAGVLHIGRDFGSECGCQIEEFDNVSRRHAIVRVADDAVVVEDQLSTNGTTVNGEPAPAYTPRPVGNGDTLGFGAHLRALMEITEAAGDQG